MKSEDKVREKLKEIYGEEFTVIQSNVEKDYFVKLTYLDNKGRRVSKFLVPDETCIPKSPRQAWRQAEAYLKKFFNTMKRALVKRFKKIATTLRIFVEIWHLVIELWEVWFEKEEEDNDDEDDEN